MGQPGRDAQIDGAVDELVGKLLVQGGILRHEELLVRSDVDAQVWCDGGVAGPGRRGGAVAEELHGLEFAPRSSDRTWFVGEQQGIREGQLGK